MRLDFGLKNKAELEEKHNSGLFFEQEMNDDIEFLSKVKSPLFNSRNKLKSNMDSKKSSFKRPLSPSLNSPTTSLVSDLSKNFHIEKNNEIEAITPMRSSFAGSKNVKSPMIIDSDSENMRPAMTSEKNQAVSKEQMVHTNNIDNTNDNEDYQFRRPLGMISNSKTVSSSSVTTTTSSTFSRNFMSSFSSSNTSTSSFQIFNESNESLALLTSTETHSSAAQSNHNKPKFNFPQRRGPKRAESTTTATAGFNHRTTSMINGSFFHVRSHSNSLTSFANIDNNLDSLCIPSPVLEKDNPCQENFIHDEESPSLRRNVGSPLQQKVRSSSRSKVRRTHSMFQTPQDVCFDDNSLQITKIGNNMTKLTFEDVSKGNSTLEKTSISTFNVKGDLIPRIDVNQFVKILDGVYNEYFSKVLIIDCRFEYEFNGGHIDGAINISSQKDLENKFLKEDCLAKIDMNSKKNDTLLIFHCEFSSYRGPLIANHLRKCDRIMNKDNYPNLYYPDILILEGGYKTFFDVQSARCFPKCYVEMNDSKHQEACERELTRLRSHSKLRNSKSLKKASSFHISHHHRSGTSFSASGFQFASTTLSKRHSSYDRLKHSRSVLGSFKKHSSAHSVSSINSIKDYRNSKQFEFRNSFQSMTSSSALSDTRTSTSEEIDDDEYNDNDNDVSNDNDVNNDIEDEDEDPADGVISSYFSKHTHGDSFSSFFDNQYIANNLSAFLHQQHDEKQHKQKSKQQQHQHHRPPAKIDFNFKFPLPSCDQGLAADASISASAHATASATLTSTSTATATSTATSTSTATATATATKAASKGLTSRASSSTTTNHSTGDDILESTFIQPIQPPRPLLTTKLDPNAMLIKEIDDHVAILNRKQRNPKANLLRYLTDDHFEH